MITEKTAIRTTPMNNIVVQTTLSHLSADNNLRRTAWVCDFCGMKHLGSAPDSCDSCGSHSITATQDEHAELGPRF